MLMTVIQGMMIGFAFVAPIGMQNLYVFNNALTNSFRRSLMYVLFVWIADSLFSLAAFFGMGAIISSVTWLRLAVMIVGGLLVLWIGWGILRSADSVQLNTQKNELLLFFLFTISKQPYINSTKSISGLIYFYLRELVTYSRIASAHLS